MFKLVFLENVFKLKLVVLVELWAVQLVFFRWLPLLVFYGLKLTFVKLFKSICSLPFAVIFV